MNMISTASALMIGQRATFDSFFDTMPKMNGIKVGQKIRPHLPAKKKIVTVSTIAVTRRHPRIQTDRVMLS